MLNEHPGYAQVPLVAKKIMVESFKLTCSSVCRKEPGVVVDGENPISCLQYAVFCEVHNYRVVVVNDAFM